MKPSASALPRDDTHGTLGNPVLLLLITGTLIGFNFPLGKLAGEAGVSPLIWALLISLGASTLSLPVLLLRRRLSVPDGRTLRYATTSALISFVLPNLLLFSVIPRVGAGYTGLMFALSPVFTLALASLFGLRTPGRLGLAGIGVGLLGAALVSLTRGATLTGPGLLWVGAALLIPMALAAGNVYRSLAWPGRVSPDVLAFWSHGASTSMILGLLWLTRGELPIRELAPAGWAAMAQLLVSGLTFPMFYRLQRRGGPVVLSQIGYVAAAVGLLAATLFLDEHYRPVTWLGAGIIALGIAMTIAGQVRER